MQQITDKNIDAKCDWHSRVGRGSTYGVKYDEEFFDAI